MTKLCIVESCEAKSRSRKMCPKHYQRWAKHGDPNVRLTSTPPIHRGADHYKWRGRDVGYHTMHKRVTAERGRAKEFRCGCGAPASDWAYDHTDPAELTDLVNGYVLPYSTDVARYKPMCRSCHRALDLGGESIATSQR